MSSVYKDILTGSITLGVGIILVGFALFYPSKESPPERSTVVDAPPAGAETPVVASRQTPVARPILPDPRPKPPEENRPDDGRGGIRVSDLGKTGKPVSDGGPASPVDQGIPPVPSLGQRVTSKVDDPGAGGRENGPGFREGSTPTPTPLRGSRKPIVLGDRPIVYEVQPDDTFQKISQRFYQTASKYRLIMDANEQIGENDLMPKMRIVIPLDPDAPGAFTLARLDPEIPPKNGGTRDPQPIPDEVVPPTVGSGKLYTVQKGDSYEAISVKHYRTRRYARMLIEENGVGQYDLRPGQTLRIPDMKVEAPTVAEKTTRTIPVGARTHVVAAGEVLGDISTRYYKTSTRWSEIAKANGITNPQRVPVGMELIIPDLPDLPVAAAPKAGSAPEQKPVAAPPTDGKFVSYTVKPGDTYGDISKKFYKTSTKHEIISKANPKYPVRSLPAGAVIQVPVLKDTVLPQEVQEIRTKTDFTLRTIDPVKPPPKDTRREDEPVSEGTTYETAEGAGKKWWDRGND